MLPVTLRRTSTDWSPEVFPARAAQFTRAPLKGRNTLAVLREVAEPISAATLHDLLAATGAVAPNRR